MNQLKDKTKIDKAKIKSKFIKMLKVLLIVASCVALIHFTNNYVKYTDICKSNHIECKKIIITDKILENVSNEYLEETSSVAFSSPLTTEKNKLVEDIEGNIDKINKLNNTLIGYKLTSEEQEKLNTLDDEFNEVSYIKDQKYKKSELEEIDSTVNSILSELEKLEETVKARLQLAKNKDIEEKIQSKINKINKLNLSSSEKECLSSLTKKYSEILESNTQTSMVLKQEYDQLSTIYSKLKKLETDVNKRTLEEEAQKQKLKEQAVLEETYENDDNDNNVTNESTTDSSGTSNVKEQSESKDTAAEKKPTTNTNDMCYSSYSEAQQVGMEQMIADSTIQKMEVDGETNCIKYYR